MIKTAVILAAGRGSRLYGVTAGNCKPLTRLLDRTLILHILLSLQESGIEHFVIVVGYRGQDIIDEVSSDERIFAKITWVWNDEWHKSNGVSVLKAKPVVKENFLLLMADHIFDPKIIKKLLTSPLKRGLTLCVDHKLSTIFDMDDATKVKLDKTRIVNIGKELEHFDAVDTGIFSCTPELFDALSFSCQNGNCSLSDGVRKLAETGWAETMDIGELYWQDVDTPESLHHAEWLMRHVISSTNTFHPDYACSINSSRQDLNGRLISSAEAL